MTSKTDGPGADRRGVRRGPGRVLRSAWRSLGLDYGWAIVLACAAILCFGQGMHSYTITVLLSPLVADFGWGRGVYSIASSMYPVLATLGSLPVGRLLDRWGPRRVILICASVSGTMWLMVSRLGLGGWGGVLPKLSILYGAMGILNAGLGSGACGLIIARWFNRRRGLALGLANVGAGLPGVILVPLSAPLIAAYGWRTLALLVSLLTWLGCVPLALWVLRDCPPDGASCSGAVRPSPLRGATIRQAMAATPFWLLGVAYLLGQFSGSGVSLHSIPYMMDRGLSRQAASNVWGFMALSGIAGKIGIGYLADRISARAASAAAMLLPAVGIATVLLWPGPLAPWCLAVGYGLGMGGQLAARPLLVQEYYGLRAYGAISGAVALLTLPGVAFGQPLAGFLFDQTRSYTVAFSLFIAAATLGTFFILAGPRPAHLAQETEDHGSGQK